MNNIDIEQAKLARLKSCSPYTNFQTGAALRTKSGKIYSGCNIENNGILSICAERTAFVKALSEGEREFESITVVGAPKGKEPTEKCLPCGYCRQFMSEFIDEDFKVILEDNGEIVTYSLDDLLPNRFEF